MSAVFEEWENMLMNLTAKTHYFFIQSITLCIQMGEKGNKHKSLANFTWPAIILMVCKNRQTPLQRMQG